MKDIKEILEQINFIKRILQKVTEMEMLKNKNIQPCLVLNYKAYKLQVTVYYIYEIYNIHMLTLLLSFGYLCTMVCLRKDINILLLIMANLVIPIIYLFHFELGIQNSLQYDKSNKIKIKQPYIVLYILIFIGIIVQCFLIEYFLSIKLNEDAYMIALLMICVFIMVLIYLSIIKSILIKILKHKYINKIKEYKLYELEPISLKIDKYYSLNKLINKDKNKQLQIVIGEDDKIYVKKEGIPLYEMGGYKLKGKDKLIVRELNTEIDIEITAKNQSQYFNVI